MRTCNECKQPKPLREFHRHRDRPGGRHLTCAECRRAHQRMKRYGLTVAEYEEMLEAQGYVCAICKQPERSMWRDRVRELAVDHDHATGRVRGLLCAACNVLIGYAGEDPEVLEAAIGYLQRTEVSA